MYTNEELGFILYNNRSIKGVVKNFLPKLNPIKLIRIESQLEKSKSKFQDDNRMVEVSIADLDLSGEDVIVSPAELSTLGGLINENIGKFNTQEYDFLVKRGIGEDIIQELKLLGLSCITSKQDLITIGATSHPVLSKILDDGIEKGGIIFPLFVGDILVNCAIRKIESDKSLKYSLSCPDIPVWGLDRINEGDIIWITEGIFDMMAMIKLGKKAISCSSAMWTGIQLYRVLEKNPGNVVIFSDKDSVGFRTAAILKDFFESSGIETSIVVSTVGKDAAEHYFEKSAGLSELEEIGINQEMINNFHDESFNFIKYLKNRKF